MPVIMLPPAGSGPNETSAVTSSAIGVPPASAITFESAIGKHAEWAAAMSSSGLVVPSAASAVRFGQETSNVPTPDEVSSTCPEPSRRPPFQAVRAVRIAMGTPFVG